VLITMMTAHSSINLVTEFLKHGGADFIEKPIDIDILHMKMQRAFYNFEKLNYEKNQRLKAEHELHVAFEMLKEKADQLKQANQQLETFAGVVAHDLKTPLAGINLITSTLQMNDVHPDYHERFKMIKDAVMDMILLVNALLDFSKLKKGTFLSKDVDTKKMIDDIVLGYSKDAKIHFTIGQIQNIKGDPILIKQVFSNLVQNVVKYSSIRPVQEIEVKSEEKDNQIIFQVKDNGIGFENSTANDIFGMYSRLETDENFEGTGIGLAIVKNIVERHNGSIWARSEPGKGSSFYFSIPIDK
jgi:signal transduction histidine kinase